MIEVFLFVCFQCFLLFAMSSLFWCTRYPGWGAIPQAAVGVPSFRVGRGGGSYVPRFGGARVLGLRSHYPGEGAWYPGEGYPFTLAIRPYANCTRKHQASPFISPLRPGMVARLPSDDAICAALFGWGWEAPKHFQSPRRLYICIYRWYICLYVYVCVHIYRERYRYK